MKIWSIVHANRYENGILIETYNHNPYSSNWDFNAVSLSDYNKLLTILERIDTTLRVPAAEYVPAIQDVFKIINETMEKK